MMKLANVLDGVVGFLPRHKVYVAVGAVWALSLALVRCDALEDGKRAERAAQAIVEAKAQETARQADAKAGATVEATKADVEAGNQRARDAAAGSDDPLKSALDAL